MVKIQGMRINKRAKMTRIKKIKIQFCKRLSKARNFYPLGLNSKHKSSHSNHHQVIITLVSILIFKIIFNLLNLQETTLLLNLKKLLTPNRLTVIQKFHRYLTLKEH